jgi:hypothetical protein
MNMEDWQNLHNRLDQAHRNSIGMSFGARDLWIMHRAVYEKLREADREWVNCRRKGVGSSRFDELLQQAEESLKNLEGHILLAKLMNKEPR